MQTWFTSDLHFGHLNVIKYCNRPYATAEEMDEALISNWNSSVQYNDEVWVIGDVFFCQVDRAHQIMRRLNGSVHLIYGNHDKVIRNQQPLQGCFASVTDGIKEINRVIDGEKMRIVMCHYPLLSWNRAIYGSLHLHGHVHSTTPTDGVARRYDVGVDANMYAPVSLQRVTSVLTKLKPIDPSPIRASRQTRI
jgi:calcineurin-like phosphoesterase family protein